jgi:hypothetical protein
MLYPSELLARNDRSSIFSKEQCGSFNEHCYSIRYESRLLARIHEQ